MNPAFAKHKGISARRAVSEEVFNREARAYRQYVMTAHGLTQENVGRVVGVTQQYVSMILDGKRGNYSAKAQRVREFVAGKVGKHPGTLWPIYDPDFYYKRWKRLHPDEHDPYRGNSDDPN